MTSQRSYSGDAASAGSIQFTSWCDKHSRATPCDKCGDSVAPAPSLTHAARAEPPKGYAVAPKEIWLQLHGDCTEDELDEPVDYIGSDDVSWCWERIHNTDVRYVRADLAAASEPTLTHAYARADERDEAGNLRGADELTPERIALCLPAALRGVWQLSPSDRACLLEFGRNVERAASSPSPAREEAGAVPHEVMQALDRMCSPLHESRLSGVTAQEDARCMKVIRGYILRNPREEAGEDARGWRPIETAPTNGGPLLIWVDTDDGGEAMTLYRNADGEWLYDGEPTYSASFYIKPTHWMPLPAAPADSAIEQMNKERGNAPAA
jgi:hypothetical protein